MALTTNLVRYFKCDEASGDLIDSTGTGNGTVTGTVGSGTGIISNARTFASTGNYVFIGADPITWTSGAFSFSIWFKTSGDATNGSVILGQNNNITGPSAGAFVPAMYVGNDGKLRQSLFYHGDVVMLTTTGTYWDNAWHHFVGTYSGTVETAYVDGVQYGQRTIAQSSYSSNYYYYLAAQSTSGWPALAGSPNYYNGSLDEIGVWQRELTAAEVTSLYNGGAGFTYPFTAAAGGWTMAFK